MSAITPQDGQGPSDDRAVPLPGRRARWLWAARAVQVRLRFLIALVVAFLVVGRWETIRAYWDRLTAASSNRSDDGAVSPDTEYFCPMDPGVLSDWPNKCPVCHMALVRRKKGDMGPLPSGVLARVQISPDRLMLAGVRTEAVGYRPLERRIALVGEVVRGAATGGRLSAEIGPEEASWLVEARAAEVRPDPPDGSAPTPARVVVIEGDSGPRRVVIEWAEAPGTPRAGRFASATVRVPMAERDPFRGMPRGTPEVRPGEPRSVFLCPDHPDVVKLGSGTCPKDGSPLVLAELGKAEKVGWWCPMHPAVTADSPGRECAECGGMALVPRVLRFSPPGEVLAVPESAVIDTGARTVVYVERMAGMFDAVEVRLGPRCGGEFPVVEGLEAGQRVAMSGAFLIDAETRLNPSLAAGYFGATRTDAPARPGPVAPAPKAARALDFTGLSPADRARAIEQKDCPVTGKPLGSMGPPFRTSARGRDVFLCCDGCEDALKEEPEKYLARIKVRARPPVARP